MKMLLIISLLTLSACASPTYTMSVGGSQAQYDKDMRECRVEATHKYFKENRGAVMFGGLGFLASNGAQQQHANEEACMNARGYGSLPPSAQ